MFVTFAEYRGGISNTSRCGGGSDGAELYGWHISELKMFQSPRGEWVVQTQYGKYLGGYRYEQFQSPRGEGVVQTNRREI